ncbi:Mu transposase C-terminal domain-containing protein [Paenibacillus sp. MBLB2552]|uniref:Mu transposase C-terminal domain-containing protein n=1 Tax=Paenibacillus mellifer TaxID=2937794 RepID=A0A9X1XY69_9BACL|nr:Mu transposase C-terminal domain-containing protein [Paenibacillus mellifer]MCK8487063.1 Mu transposase C-terminal domain-containing protein [Paenibacillus mellifer]
MEQQVKEQMAAFRYSLIAPIVSRQTPMAPGEIKAYLEQAAQQTYHIPGSTKTRVSIRSLERYLSQYRSGQWEALKPKGRSKRTATGIPASVLQEAIRLRKERPERSVEQIIFMLKESGLVAQTDIAASTLARQLKKAGASRKDLIQSQAAKGFRRFEAEDVHVLWQFDFQHTLYLPDPADPKKKKKAILFAILDDYSRLITHAQFYWDEKLPRMEDSLKKAILKHGIPEQFYCDNGAAFSSQHLVRICGKLGIRLSHSTVFRPQGRGKIERFFHFIDTSFKPEAYQQIEQGRILTLEELNQGLAAWIEGYYHIREHGSTKQPPKVRAESSSRKPRRATLAELMDIFLWEETRKVDKTGCVSLAGNAYEVDLELCGERVQLRYDPFDLSRIQVWHQDKQWPDATVIDLTRRYDKRVKPEAVQLVEEHDGQLSFLELAEQKRQAALAEQDPVSYAAGGGGQA